MSALCRGRILAPGRTILSTDCSTHSPPARLGYLFVLGETRSTSGHGSSLGKKSRVSNQCILEAISGSVVRDYVVELGGLLSNVRTLLRSS